MRSERIGLVVAGLVIFWLAATLVRVENERYVMAVGMCWNESRKLPDLDCVRKAQTRTAWYWHLFYALTE